jgi:adenylosuccinate synthase
MDHNTQLQSEKQLQEPGTKQGIKACRMTNSNHGFVKMQNLCNGREKENVLLEMQVVLDMHDSNYGKYPYVYSVNIVWSKKPK